ncbi:MAG: DUF1385 domain-containing protein [Clostridiales bacterium]|nr:DUF1385 domain-containing protein [Clostridiales bacterium]
MSEVNNNDIKDIKPALKKTTIGGQALIEGIMMVGPKRTAIAVRKGDGTIYVEEMTQSDRVTFYEKVPFVRGCIRFYKMLVRGTDALMKSADISEQGAPEPPEEEGKKQSALDQYLSSHYNVMVTLSAILGILLSVGLFILLPWLIVFIAAKIMGSALADTAWMSVILNLAEGVLRMVIFFLYLRFASKIEGIDRVWRYHGAEHKTIACYEAGEPLTVENILKHSRFHPRCGTSFMFLVLAISILIYTIAGILIGDGRFLVSALIRILLIPVICGISFEILRFVGRHDNNAVCRGLSKPGLWLQRFTTSEPDAPIVEVAIAAMQAVIPEDADEDVW